MGKKLILASAAVAVAFFGMSLYAIAGEGMKGMMMDPYIPKEKVMKMKEMMMKMKPDTLEAATMRGEKMFNNPKLGKNETGQSCATCHSGGGSIGGAAEMSWKGMTMKVAIPTLKGAAVNFPAIRGPMKRIADLGDMNNMCIMTFMKGLPLNKNMRPAVDLQAYVASLSKGKRFRPGGKKVVPTPVPGAM